MLVPAGIFHWLNAGTPYAHGWGVVMATDTAFAVGLLALLGHRVPAAAVTFLTALAIIDDLGAITVIALFYSASVNLGQLAASAGIVLLLVACNLLGIRAPAVYFLGGGLTWLTLLGSGVHATIAGVLVAAAVPAQPKRPPRWFLQRTYGLVGRFETIENRKADSKPMLGEEEQHMIAEHVRDAAEKATTPLRRWERALEHPVALFVLPIFALANAGVTVDADMAGRLWQDSLAVGIVLGLVVGKSVGIPLAAGIAARLNLGTLPPALHFRHIIGIGLLGGMGFTMSIFITRLGFAASPETMEIAKVGILSASVLAGLAGYLWLRLGCQRARPSDVKEKQLPHR